MPPLLCHVWLRPSLSVRNEKGIRSTLETAQMRFCRVTCWKKFTLSLQQKHRSPQMWYGGSTKLFLNFRRSRVDPCLWTNSTTGVSIGRHMDDFIKTGPPMAVQAVTEYLERVAQLKVTGVLDKFGKQARFLGSFITKVHGGYTIQTDTETLLAGLRDLNLEHCKPSKLPGATPRTHDLTPLDPSEHKLYRRVVGRFLYCSAHRGDFAFTLNQLCRRVQSPTVSDMQALRKLARYIKGTLHYKLNIRPRHNTDLKIEVYIDADWAGQFDRHSITGGFLVLDGVNVSLCYERRSGGGVGPSRAPHWHLSADNSTTPLRQYSSHGNCNTSRSWLHETRAGTRSCFATMDCRWPFDPTKSCELCKCCRPSHETCVTECTPVSRPETWSSTVTTRQYVCWNVVLVCGQMERKVHLCIGWISSRLACACWASCAV